MSDLISTRDRVRVLFAALHESGCGTTRTCRGDPTTSAVGGRTNMPFKRADFRVGPIKEVGTFTIAALCSASPSVFMKPWGAPLTVVHVRLSSNVLAFRRSGLSAFSCSMRGFHYSTPQLVSTSAFYSVGHSLGMLVQLRLSSDLPVRLFLVPHLAAAAKQRIRGRGAVGAIEPEK
jgi:hypothetical protein